MKLLPLALLLTIMLALAACQTAAPAGATPGEATSAEGGDADNGGGDNGDNGEDDADVDVHGAADLEALIPDEVGGSPLTVNSVRGEESLEASGIDVEAITERLGRSVDDVSVAIAGDADGQIAIFALRIEGASGEQILEATLEQNEAFTWEEQNIGGKNVFAPETGGVYLYAAGDVLFQVYGQPEVAEDALSQLP